MGVHPPLKFPGEYSLGAAWKGVDSTTYWTKQGQSNEITGLVVTDFNYPAVSALGRVYTYPDTDDGRELTALRMADRCDEIMNSLYDQAKDKTQTGPDEQGFITFEGTLANGVTPDHRKMRKYIAANTSHPVCITEAWTGGATSPATLIARLEQQIWNTAT